MGTGGKKVRGVGEEHTCITHGHEKLWGMTVGGALLGGGQRGETWDNGNSINNKDI